MSSAVIRAAARLLDASYLDEAPTDGQRELWRESACEARDEIDKARAEIDRLRALPVLRTCGECGHASSRLRPRPLCGNPSLFDRPRPELLSIDHEGAPPERCPLRGGAR